MRRRILSILFIYALFAHVAAPTGHAQDATRAALPPLWAVDAHKLESTTLQTLQNLAARSDQIIGIELWVAASSGRQLQSLFGHSLLRFVMKSPTDGAGNRARDAWTADPVLAFVANVPGKLSIRKGIVGGYAMTPIVQPLSAFWENYIRSEGREIRRTVLVSNSKMRTALVQALVAWASNPKSLGDYTFFSSNCATALAKLLREAGFTTVGSVPLRPKSVPRHFRENLYVSYPDLKIPSIYGDLERAQKALEVSPLDFANGENWPEDAADRLIAVLDPLARVRLIQELIRLPGEVRRALNRSLEVAFAARISPLTLAEILGVVPVAPELYEICDSFECGDRHALLASELWGAKAMRQYDSRLKNDFARLVDRSHWRPVMVPEVLSRHYQYTVGER